VGLLVQGDEPGGALGWAHSVVLGVVEGLTEFLPVSSTGHLILTDAVLGRSDPAFVIAIQAGAITAIVFLYWRMLWRAVRDLRAGVRTAGVAPRTNLLVLIAVAAIPATVLGLLFEERIEDFLFSTWAVAVALIVWGVVFLVIERRHDRAVAAGAARDRTLDELTVRDALWIGLWQAFALVPGTSRSGATIIGGMVTGLGRGSAAEFSFLLGLPILYGACVLKLLKDYARLTGPMLPDLLLASAVSFVTAVVVVGAFVRFLRRHTFRPFAWYRIALGLVVLALCASGRL
jgi:undecaprenyl-diphosphatase